MSYCLNPACQQPQNPGNALFCQCCGARLRLGDRYRPLRPLGQGGFGKTFLAVDEARPHQPRCVIKQLLPAQPGERSLQKATLLFQQEAERLALLGNHPQIPALLAHFEQLNGQFLVQEFIDGQTLAAALAQDGPFGDDQIRSVLRDLLPVLDFIHSHQVIHRDIKPDNIIRPYGGGPLVLVDFGASKYATGTALARTGTVIGSAGYVAPEQAMGKAEFSSDFYSLGVTCIHLLTAIHPFDLYSVSDDGWIWRQYLTVPVSEALGQVLDKMLQRATSQRYGRAAEVERDLAKLPGRVPSLAANLPDRRRSAGRRPPLSASRQERVKRRPNPRRWTCQATLTGHNGPVTAIALSPDGQILASGSSDRQIKLWNLATGEMLHTFGGRSLWFGAGHRERISSLTFSPDGELLISGSDDGRIKLWQVGRKQILTTLENHGWIVSALALSPDGQLLAQGDGDGTVQLWDMGSQTILATLDQHRDWVSGVAFSPSGAESLAEAGPTLVTSSYDKTIRLWDISTRRLLNTLRGHSDRISAIALSPDGRTLFSASWDQTLKRWDLARQEEQATLKGHSDRVTCVAVRPDGQVVASGGDDSTICLWNADQGDRLWAVRHGWGVTALCFTPDGQQLVSSSADETIKIWRQEEASLSASL